MQADNALSMKQICFMILNGVIYRILQLLHSLNQAAAIENLQIDPMQIDVEEILNEEIINNNDFPKYDVHATFEISGIEYYLTIRIGFLLSNTIFTIEYTLQDRNHLAEDPNTFLRQWRWKYNVRLEDFKNRDNMYEILSENENLLDGIRSRLINLE